MKITFYVDRSIYFTRFPNKQKQHLVQTTMSETEISTKTVLSEWRTSFPKIHSMLPIILPFCRLSTSSEIIETSSSFKDSNQAPLIHGALPAAWSPARHQPNTTTSGETLLLWNLGLQWTLQKGAQQSGNALQTLNTSHRRRR